MQKTYAFPIIQSQEKFIINLILGQQLQFVGSFHNTQHGMNEYLVKGTD